MPNTTNLVLPYPAASDPPGAQPFAALAQAVDAFAGPWISWTPTMTQLGAVTLGVQYAKYRLMGKMLEFTYAVAINSAGTAGNPVLITLPPVAPKFTTTDMPRGLVDFVSGGTQGSLVSPAGNTTQVRIEVFGGNYTTGLGAADTHRGWGQYEVA